MIGPPSGGLRLLDLHGRTGVGKQSSGGKAFSKGESWSPFSAGPVPAAFLRTFIMYFMHVMYVYYALDEFRGLRDTPG